MPSATRLWVPGAGAEAAPDAPPAAAFLAVRIPAQMQQIHHILALAVIQMSFSGLSYQTSSGSLNQELFQPTEGGCNRGAMTGRPHFCWGRQDSVFFASCVKS